MRTINNILRRTDENGNDINNTSSTLTIRTDVFDGTLIIDTFNKALSITARVTGDDTITYYDINDNLMENPKDATNEEQTYPVIAKVVEVVSGMVGNEITLTATKIFYKTVVAALTSPTIGYKSYSAPQVPNKLEVEVTNVGDAKDDTYIFI